MEVTRDGEVERGLMVRLVRLVKLVEWMQHVGE